MADGRLSTAVKKINRLKDWVKSINPYNDQPNVTQVSSSASRFAQTLLKKLSEYNHVDQNIFSFAKAIIEINEFQDNKDELAQDLIKMAKRLLAVERTIAIGIPKVAERETKRLIQTLQMEMERLDLALRALVIQTLHHEDDRVVVIIQCVNDALMAFQFGVANSIQKKADMVSSDFKTAALRGSLHPSEKADHRGCPLRREECTYGTRVNILEDITKWANDPSSDSPRVFWLTAEAGSGKTTIAYTIARRFDTGGNANQHAVLGGNFLCSQQFEETQRQSCIISTIAYQLAMKCKSYADALYSTNKFNTDTHDVVTQLKNLLIGPWQQSEPTRHPELPPYLIIIDALDEIKDDRGAAFLHDFLVTVNNHDLRGFKFLVTSRSHLEVTSLSFTFEAICHLRNIPIEETKQDIVIYLKERLKELDGCPELDELVRWAGGLFIYAATAVRYLTPPGLVTVAKQLQMLNDLCSRSYSSKPSSANNATLSIDNLYQQIMWDAFSKFKGKNLTRRLRILYTFLCTAEHGSTSIVAALGGLENDQIVKAVLHDLYAVFYTQGDRIFWYHASFSEFIFTQARSNFGIGKKNAVFSCNKPFHHKLLSKSCFDIMKSGLRFNMGNIPSSFLFDHDNTVALSEQVNQNIDHKLRYSCRYWAHHLATAELVNTDNLCDLLSDFLQLRILFWIEAMNLLGLCDQCAPMLQCARQWVLKSENRPLTLADDLDEAANFSTYFAESPAAESTPHLYISVLTTWWQTSSLCQNWKKTFSRAPCFTGVQLPAVEGHTHKVNCVAFSTDGTQIISGSDDRSIRIWDTYTGVQMQVLKGHTDSVTSVKFSTDGTRVVSGSDDESVRVWDVATGVHLQVFYRHTRKVSSVGFSSDGTRVISGSYDNSVRMWDASTGVEMQVFNGHTDFVTSVTFSPNGQQIISGSYDKSVRVWNASQNLQVQVLNGHTLEVCAVAISPDGNWIASGSHDKSVRVWDVALGVCLQVINGHVGWVTSVAFSPDGTWIVSGSQDQSVRLWDTSKGVQLQMFEGHTHYVTSVSFSTDGTHIASGSEDKSISVWGLPTPVKPNQSIWTRASRNWIISFPERDRLMWIPKLAPLIRPFNTLIISNSGFIVVDFHQSMIGDNWVRCYTP